MKKIFNIFVFATLVGGFVACGDSTTKETEQAKADEVKNETTVEKKDAEPSTTEAQTDDASTDVTRGGSESEGFGRCFESGCYCKAFKGRGQTCQNCGHAYGRHY